MNIGMVRDHLGQRYVVENEYRRIRRDGTEAVILVWSSQCAQCGEPFTFTSPAASTKFQPNRRCQQHKRPGQRVKKAGELFDLAKARDSIVWGDPT